MDTSEVKCCDRARIEAQERLLDLAGVYRSLNRKELAHALRREGSKLVPSTGNPKLDYLVSLAEVLDWPVGDVAEAIWAGTMSTDEPNSGEDFRTLDRAARKAHRAGDYAAMCRLAQRMRAAAGSAEERALAALREAGGWDGRGRHLRQLECVRRGLEEVPVSPDLRLLLEVNLANAHYALGALVEARAVAAELIDRFRRTAPESRGSRAAEAFAHYVFGNVCRQLVGQGAESARETAEEARDALRASQKLYTALAGDFDHEPWYGIANTCRGGLLEVEVELGERASSDALQIISTELEAIDPGSTDLVGDRLESYGWWCIFGCSIALRHERAREQQRLMTLFIETGRAIADRLDNWSMRQHLFTLEYIRRQRLNQLVGCPVEWTIDEDGVRVLIGTMGRFPSFRRTGWQILETATPVTTIRSRRKINASTDGQHAPP
jgi:hypothetical protein